MQKQIGLYHEHVKDFPVLEPNDVVKVRKDYVTPFTDSGDQGADHGVVTDHVCLFCGFVPYR